MVDEEVTSLTPVFTTGQMGLYHDGRKAKAWLDRQIKKSASELALKFLAVSVLPTVARLSYRWHDNWSRTTATVLERKISAE